MRAFAAGAAILLTACQSILGIGDTTLRQDDGPAIDAPLSLDAPLAADAPPGDASVFDAASDAACGTCATSGQCPAQSPACVSCFCTTCTSNQQCKERAAEVGDHAVNCNGSGKCVECRTDDDCHGAAPTCDPFTAGGTCVAPTARACGSAFVPPTSSIAAPPIPAYQMGGSFTIEVWVRPTAFQEMALIAGDAPASGVGSYGLYLDATGVPFFSITNPGASVTTTNAMAAFALDAGVWTHLAGTYDSSDGHMVLWVNGTARGSAFVSSPPKPAPTAPFTLGGGYAGYLDEVRLSTGLRYSAAFFPERFFAPASQDVAHFHFDEVDGRYAVDVSPNGNDALLGSNAIFSDVCQYYRCRSVVTFGGYAQAEPVAALQPPSSFTLEAFIQPENLDGSGASNINVIDRAAGNDHRGYHLFIDTSTQSPGFEVSCDGQNWHTALSSTKLELFTWTHLAGIYDASAGRLFFWQDGVLVKVTEMFNDCPGHVFDSGEPLMVASDFGGFARFRGFVDELRLSSTIRYTTSFADTVFDMPGLAFPDDEAATLALYHFDEEGLVLAVNSSADDNPAALVVNGTNVGFDTRCF